MKEEFVSYLNSIGATEIARKRAATIYAFYQEVCPEEITGIFVTDFVNEDGRREFENLWFFSETLVMEAKRFLTTDEFDMVSLREGVPRWEVKKQDYDFKQATDASRFFLEFTLGVGFATMGADLKASGENCDYLKEIFLKYVVPNFEGSQFANGHNMSQAP